MFILLANIEVWFSELIANYPFVLQGLIAGLISFFTPCSLALIPGYVGFITSSSKNRFESFVLSLVYIVGYILTYAIVTVIIVTFFNVFDAPETFTVISGIVMIVLAFILFFLAEIQVFFRNLKKKKNNAKIPQESIAGDENQSIDINSENQVNESEDHVENISSNKKLDKSFYAKIIGAFILGFTSGGASNSCTSIIYGSVLTRLLENNVSLDIQLYTITFYALGLMVPILLIGLLVGEINTRYLAKMIKVSGIVSKVFAVVLLWFGLEMMLAGLGYHFIFKHIP